MQIQPFELKQKQEVLTIFKQYPYMFEPQELEIIETDLVGATNSYVFVAEEDDLVVGCIIFGHPSDSTYIVEITAIAVDHNHEQKNIGSLLLTHIEKYVKENDLSNDIFLRTGYSEDPLSKAAITFFQKNGYQQVGIIPNYWDTEDSCIIFHKSLT